MRTSETEIGRKVMMMIHNVQVLAQSCLYFKMSTDTCADVKHCVDAVGVGGAAPLFVFLLSALCRNRWLTASCCTPSAATATTNSSFSCFEGDAIRAPWLREAVHMKNPKLLQGHEHGWRI